MLLSLSLRMDGMKDRMNDANCCSRYKIVKKACDHCWRTIVNRHCYYNCDGHTYIWGILTVLLLCFLPPTCQGVPSMGSHAVFSCGKKLHETTFPVLQNCLDRAKIGIRHQNNRSKKTCGISQEWIITCDFIMYS